MTQGPNSRRHGEHWVLSQTLVTTVGPQSSQKDHLLAASCLSVHTVLGQKVEIPEATCLRSEISFLHFDRTHRQMWLLAGKFYQQYLHILHGI